MDDAQVPEGKAGEPLLGPGTVTWLVNREGTLLVGGGRALLLQVAHPLVMAGVEQHSNYDSDPWGRLIGTLETTFQIVFGDPESSAAASARLRRRHDHVKGTSAEGVPYDAQDPALMIWVWATLVESALVVYERCVAALSDEQRDRFYEEQKLFAYACGVPQGACPESYGDFTSYYERVLAEELRVTPGARAVADSIVNTPVPLPLRPLLGANALLTAGLLPEPLRSEYGFAWGPGKERSLRVALAMLRAGNRVTPRVLRERPATWLANGSLRRGVGARVIDRLRVAAQS
jgi:uncharacterized protein (DUF2236 family)